MDTLTSEFDDLFGVPSPPPRVTRIENVPDPKPKRQRIANHQKPVALRPFGKPLQLLPKERKVTVPSVDVALTFTSTCASRREHTRVLEYDEWACWRIGGAEDLARRKIWALEEAAEKKGLELVSKRIEKCEIIEKK